MSTTQTDINEKMRAILIDWLVEVHLKFKLLPDTLFQTVNIIDRFLEKVQVCRQKLQLVGVAAMFIACKYEEIYAPEVRDFVYVTDQAYTKEEIFAMEGKILSVLEFNITFPTSFRFLERMTALSKYEERNTMLARYLIELALVEHKMIKYAPSLLAAGAIYLVNKIRKRDPFPPVIAKTSKRNVQDVKNCAKDLCLLLRNIETCSLQAVRRKFTSPKFCEVAKIRIEKN